ncbi:hypothetical protein ACGFMM_00715 [Streptomyces sp. NPDC048604]|uniref:hypothetical protein n=1 Tax=Streptomyces sp. NPDC048604 TaxID=3365578 RepID=UPI00370FEAB8
MTASAGWPARATISPYVRSKARRASRATSTASAARPLAVSARRVVTAFAACCPYARASAYST